MRWMDERKNTRRSRAHQRARVPRHAAALLSVRRSNGAMRRRFNDGRFRRWPVLRNVLWRRRMRVLRKGRRRQVPASRALARRANRRDRVCACCVRRRRVSARARAPERQSASGLFAQHLTAQTVSKQRLAYAYHVLYLAHETNSHVRNRAATKAAQSAVRTNWPNYG